MAQYPVIHLLTIQRPFQELSFYFTSEKFAELRSKLKESTDEYHKNGSGIIIRFEGVESENRLDNLLKEMDDFEQENK